MYLVFIWGLIILIFLQPNLIHVLNSSILGRGLIVLSVILFNLKHKKSGLIYLLFIMLAINSIPDRMEGLEALSPEEYSDDLVIHYTDREKTEKQMITPKPDNIVSLITPLDNNDEPLPSEPTTESFNYSRFP